MSRQASKSSFYLRVSLAFVILVSNVPCVAYAGTEEKPCEKVLNRTAEKDVQFKNRLSQRLDDLCGERACGRLSILRGLSETIRNSPRYRKAKSYMALVGVMVGTSSLTLAISSLVGSEHSMLSGFLTIFLSQVTTLGVYVVGAPIWEPLTSAIRTRGYMHTHPQEMDVQISNLQELEDQYFRTNSMLSINAQMSRNILRDYIQIALENLNHARENLSRSEGRDLVAQQILEILVRLSTLYPEVDPLNPVVLDAIHSGFTNFIEDRMAIQERVLSDLRKLEGMEYLELTVREWLK